MLPRDETNAPGPEQGYTVDEYSVHLREANRLEERARKLRRYDELAKKYPEVLELIKLHYDMDMVQLRVGNKY